MGHVITLGDVLIAASAIAGGALLVGGAMTTFAGMMDGSAGSVSTQGKGCVMQLAGLAMLLLCAWNLL